MRAPRCEVGRDRRDAATPDGAPLSRRSALSGAMTLAAACALGACSARPAPGARPAAALQAGTELGRLIDGTPDLVVAGEPLNVQALRRFYARQDFGPVWASRPLVEQALVATVLRAGDHGLDPELFHANLLRRRETFPPLRRELLLTDAILAYAGALAHGAMPAQRRKDFEALMPQPVDVAEALGAAITSQDPAAAIEALAPATATYRGLREALQNQRAGGPAAGGAAANRQRIIEANLERERWLPRPLPAERVWVNVPDQHLVLYRHDRPVFSTRVVVGDSSERNQSPEFNALIEASFFNPPWIVPRDIVVAEILPKLDRDPDYLARNNMVMRANGEVEQLPGPTAGLGYILFDMPNRFDVYLHDTPDRFLFSRSDRRMSRGCIRVQNPREFAALLMEQPLDSIDRKIEVGGTTRSTLPKPVPVFVAYQTAFADVDGKMQFRPDFYNRDADLWRRLQKYPQGQALAMP